MAVGAGVLVERGITSEPFPASGPSDTVHTPSAAVERVENRAAPIEHPVSAETDVEKKNEGGGNRSRSSLPAVEERESSVRATASSTVRVDPAPKLDAASEADRSGAHDQHRVRIIEASAADTLHVKNDDTVTLRLRVKRSKE